MAFNVTCEAAKPNRSALMSERMVVDIYDLLIDMLFGLVVSGCWVMLHVFGWSVANVVQTLTVKWLNLLTYTT